MRGLLKLKSLELRKLVTATTRERRPREVNGKTYYYVSEERFKGMIAHGELLEWAPVRRHRFGTPREPLLSWLKRGWSVIQQIDVRGADALRHLRWLNVVTIFILPGSVGELKRRLNSKAFSPAERRIRWRETMREFMKQPEYDYRVVNAEGRLAQTIAEVAGIIRSLSGAAPPRREGASRRKGCSR